MLVAAALALLVGGAPILPPPAPMAVSVVPDEPGAVTLPEVPTYQAVAADVDGDGVREVVRLVQADRGAIDLEVWRASGGSWELLASPVNAIPVRPTGGQGNVVYAGTPARLLVRTVAGVDHATLVRQPRFAEPGLEAECCLLLDDLVVVDGALALVRVADRGPSADAVLAIDMDGDGTDELLVTRGLPPLGDTNFPTVVRLYRWAGTAFAPAVVTEILVGSGTTPFVLGDSDGLPGDEAAFIGAQDRLHRLSLRDGDTVHAESAEASVSGAMGVPLGSGRGIALMSALSGLSVRAWPRDEPIGQPLPAESLTPDGRLLGVVTGVDGSYLAVRRSAVDALHLLSLPELGTIGGPTVTRSPAAGTLASSPTRPFVGELPRGGPDGEPALVYAGRLIQVEPDAPSVLAGIGVAATMAGMQPIGLVGPDRAALALLHAPLPIPPLDPSGGGLEAPTLQPGSGVAIAPLGLVREAELDDGVLDPAVQGGIEDGRELIVGASGFTVMIEAPAGSRVSLAETDPAVIGEVRVVPSDGTLRVPVVPPPFSTPNPRYRALLAVTTPAGRGYLAAWDVRVLNQPPPIRAAAVTALGSVDVLVSGATDPDARVVVAGRSVTVDELGRFSLEVAMPPWPTEVEVVATDPVGNAARTTVVGVGWFDYRGLPWIPITIALVGLAGVVLFLRVPRTKDVPRPASDDGALEELEPD